MNTENRSQVEALLRKGVIYFGGPVNEDMLEMTKYALGYLILHPIDTLYIVVSSDGGKGYVGLDIFNLLMTYSHKKIGIVANNCRSAAVNILLAGDERYALPGSRILIHFGRKEVPRAIFFNDKKLKAFVRAEKKVQKEYERPIAIKTRMSINKIRSLCAKDIDLTTKEAEKLGIITGVWEGHFPFF